MFYESFSAAVEGILLCYGPLALMLIGFVAFAWLTDADARRTYLRRLDLRPEAEAPEVLPPVLTQRTVAYTPAGSRVIIDPTAGTASQAVGVIEEEAAPPAQAQATEDTDTTTTEIDEAEADAASGEPDDLTVIEGIGPKMSAALQAAGITTYAQLAASSEDTLRAAVEAAGMRLAPSISTWAEQAEYAARGDWDGLEQFQSQLEGGRRVDSDGEEES